MAKRNFSMIEYFNQRVKDWTPELHFTGDSKAAWQAWHEEALSKLQELLGDYPEPVALVPDVVYSIEHDGLIRERVVFDSEAHMSVPCVVLKPTDMANNGQGRAILCSHGHGPYGKEPVAGNRSTPELVANIAQHHYNYAEEMARRGYLTIAPDLRVFGERDDGGNPYPGRDKCNVHFIRGMILGVYTLTLNIWDMKRCIDYLQTRPEVDPERIGMMGLSQGGTMTTFTSAVEPRIKAADIIGYVNSWKGFGVNRSNFCGSQIVPDIFKYLDVPDIAGLISPRPLLIEMGIFDTCFYIEDQMEGYNQIQRIYEAAGVGDRLWADVHPHEHGFAGDKAYDFFEEYL
jgi:hypothetical protein